MCPTAKSDQTLWESQQGQTVLQLSPSTTTTEVTGASALAAFTLKLAGHPKFKEGPPVEVVIDGALLAVGAANSISFSRRDGAWAAAKYEAPPTAKQRGGSLKLVSPSKLALQTLKIVGLLNLFEVFDDESQAVESYA